MSHCNAAALHLPCAHGVSAHSLSSMPTSCHTCGTTASHTSLFFLIQSKRDSCKHKSAIRRTTAISTTACRRHFTLHSFYPHIQRTLPPQSLQVLLVCAETITRSCHTAFTRPSMALLLVCREDHALAKTMVSYWTNFATVRVPCGNRRRDAPPPVSSPYHPAARHTFSLPPLSYPPVYPHPPSLLLHTHPVPQRGPDRRQETRTGTTCRSGHHTP